LARRGFAYEIIESVLHRLWEEWQAEEAGSPLTTFEE
jgi:SOS response regulatory protein OraA/RecX